LIRCDYFDAISRNNQHLALAKFMLSSQNKTF